MPYVVSTLTDSVIYTEYNEIENGAADKVRSVKINGGANLVDKRLILSDSETFRKAVRTEITQDEAGFLQSNPVFITHFNNGFVEIVNDDVKPEKVAKNMTSKDKATQLTEEDSKDGGRVQGIQTKKPD
jgi:hypothetical protein